MTLEIHKAADAADAVIELTETFPGHYTAEQTAEVCETEAVALVEALNAALPKETKAALVRLVVSGRVF
jgi:hypothetical protein